MIKMKIITRTISLDGGGYEDDGKVSWITFESVEACVVKLAGADYATPLFEPDNVRFFIDYSVNKRILEDCYSFEDSPAEVRQEVWEKVKATYGLRERP